jgi:hypothetical protein
MMVKRPTSKKGAPKAPRAAVSLVSEPSGLGFAKVLANPQIRLASREQQPRPPIVPPKAKAKGRSR